MRRPEYSGATKNLRIKKLNIGNFKKIEKQHKHLVTFVECLKRAVLVILILQPSIFSDLLLSKNKTRFRGRSSIFSRERGALSEKKSKILQTFSLVDQIDYLGSPKSLLGPHFFQFSAPQQRLKKNRSKSRFWAFFGKF